MIKQISLDSMLEQTTEVSKILKALAHPQRLLILCALVEGPKNVGELTELCEGSQSMVSQFLTRMRSEGILSSEKKAQKVEYAIADPKVRDIVRNLYGIFCPATQAQSKRRSS